MLIIMIYADLHISLHAASLMIRMFRQLLQRVASQTQCCLVSSLVMQGIDGQCVKLGDIIFNISF